MPKRLVLLGAGHAHVEVLRTFALRPLDGAALTVISPHTHVPYTGMMPGVLAGRYSPAAASIDAGALAARAGAAFLRTSAARVDPQRKTVLCEDGAELAYDVLSINIGAVALNPLRSTGEARVLATKPAEPFIAALEEDLSGAFAVIGGGHGGIELAAALALRGAAVSLLAGRAGLAPASPASARAMLARRLAARGVAVVGGADAVSADARAVTLDDGRAIPADKVVLAAGVAPPPLFGALDLPKDASGFLRVGADLSSVGDPAVFAAGDSASFGGLAKAGVHAVREGPVLAANLRAALAGRGRTGAGPRRFRPQTDFLSILSFWPEGAVAIRGGLAAEGRWADRWKEAIDRRFIARYRL